MRQRVSISRKTDTDYEITVRPSIRPLTFVLLGVPVVAFVIFGLTAALAAVLDVNSNWPERLFFVGWAALGMLLAAYFTFMILWRAIGREVLDIGPTELTIMYQLGQRELKVRVFDIPKVRNMRLQKLRYTAKSHPFAHHAIFFDYGDREIHFGLRLPPKEIQSLLDGPLRVFTTSHG